MEAGGGTKSVGEKKKKGKGYAWEDQKRLGNSNRIIKVK